MADSDGTPPDPAAHDAGATLDAWRARGDDRVDPVRFRFLEAFARRSATQTGELRRVLDATLAAHLAAYRDACRSALKAHAAEAAPKPPAAPAPGALAALATALARAEGGSTAAPALQALGHFRTTWSRLSADRRLTQSLASVPDNAGPLNSQALVHRALLLMRELSPAYLHRVMEQVDALLWLEQASLAAPPKEPPRAGAPRKPNRGKAATSA